MNNLAIIKLSFLFFLVIGLVSCIKQGSELKKVYCPPPPIPECLPQSYSGSYYDTSSIGLNDFYYKLRKVKNINTNSDEWQISYNHDNFFLTFTDNNTQKATFVKKIDVDEFIISRGIDFIDNKHFGSIEGKGQNIILTSSNLSSKDNIIRNISNGIGFSRIFKAKLTNNQISNLEIIPIETKLEDWVGQPTFFQSDKVIFFSSDKEGGFGGNDIWYVYQKNDGKWSKPINCGANINTPCDELSPFIDVNGKTLLFSSSGHKTVGGYDIFKSSISENFEINYSDTNKISSFFANVQNLGTPINTVNDELFPFSDTEIDSVLYFSSNRDNNNFDIFVIHKNWKVKERAKVEVITKNDEIKKENEKQIIKDTIKLPEPDKIVDVKVTLRGKVMDENRIIILDSAKIDIQKIPDFISDTSLFTNNQGEFEVDLTLNKDYRITAHKDQYFYDSKDITVDSNLIKNELTFYLPVRGAIRINFPLDEWNNPYRYTLDSNGIETGRKWEDELDIVAENIKYSLNRIDKVILVGHTDYLDTDEYNIKLGERRVNFIINELVKRGIPKDKLFGRSAGENELLEKRKNENEENFRKRLRRVTIEKILTN